MQNEKVFPCKRRMTAVSLIGMIFLPILTHFLIKYICTYFSGDIRYENVSTVFDYIYHILARVVNYVSFGILTWSIYRLGVRKSGMYILFSAFGIMIPYLSDFLIELLIGSISQTYKIYLFSFFMYPFDLMTLALIVSALPLIGYFTRAKGRGRRGKNKISKSEDTAERVFVYSEKELNRAYLFITVLLATLSLVNELYYTITFIWQLKNEYFRSIDPSEVVSLITSYFECFFFALIGYTVMKLTAYFLTVRERKAELKQ